MVHNLKFKILSVALGVALLPISVFAAGLGKLNVDSAIGEPLKAEIELLSVSPEELATINAGIASQEAYSAQGIERPASHNDIRAEITKNASGTPILKLRSSQPIDEPFLDMLIQVDWNTGRLVREYTVLLDPPGYKGEIDSASQGSKTTQLPKVDADVATKEIVTPGQVAANAKMSSENKTEVELIAETEVDTSDAINADDGYVTKSGDTLSKIAREMKPEGISLDQMLVGLFEANREAFSGNNMNRLKVGQILRPPSEDALNVVSRKEASNEVKVQTENWNVYRNKLANIIADSAPIELEESAQSTSGKIKSAAEDKSASASAGPKDVVKLSAGDVQDSAETKSLQAKVAALQEEIVAREKGLKEAQEKTAALEKQITDMQKLLELKSGAMAEMQKQAEAQVAAEAQTKQAETVPPAPEQPAEVVAEKKEPVTAGEKPTIKPQPMPVEEPSLLTGLLEGQDLPLLGGAGGLIALLGSGWLYLRHKRKKNLADFEQGIMTSGGLKANTVFGNTSGTSVDTGDTSFLTDFSQSATGGMIDTNDVDPIAEAEVYMAYGRDAQAEEILKDAISKEPKRYELHLKLLEMYAASKNMSAFETVSGELYTTLGADDPTWAKVAEIGIKLEPNNPLYQVNNAVAGSSKLKEAEGKLDASDFSDSPLAAESDLDFSLDSEALNESAQLGSIAVPEAETEDNALDLNLDIAESSPETEVLAGALDFTSEQETTWETIANLSEPVEAAKSESTTLDFDLSGLTDVGAKAEESASEPETGLAPESSLGFAHTMPDLEFPELATEEPVKTEDNAPQETALNMQLDEPAPAFESTFQNPEDEKPELPALEMAAEIETVEIEGAIDAPDDNNFGFDITTISPDVSKGNDEETIEANTLDLSGIDLNMEETNSAGVDLEIVADEPAEVETKLELVAAYMEMDDKEGAKELLDEVMREGGANQRKRAEALLTQLG